MKVQLGKRNTIIPGLMEILSMLEILSGMPINLGKRVFHQNYSQNGVDPASSSENLTIVLSTFNTAARNS